MTASKKNKIILDSEALEIRKKLIEAASKGETLTYSDLVSDDDDRHMGKLSKTLARISCYERNEDRPFLCALVVQKATGVPSTGFFMLCDDLGIDHDLEDLQRECFEYWGENKK
ncbi:hypothetical protein CLV62_12573 [Dysgonomonas alginatilytica]|uniref:Uncharacterized protein n=1 Tax=Dysgonomonas alginatilytica TaxID=1605892 RepID=A0A2V3PMW9_9BACT|nr:hypothetical protein [Dysgonomonas alginatilytica]PXV61240.1 hypothetical protein CLV62_12573 [Dysgonomonas alginatilytica]